MDPNTTPQPMPQPMPPETPLVMPGALEPTTPMQPVSPAVPPTISPLPTPQDTATVAPITSDANQPTAFMPTVSTPSTPTSDASAVGTASQFAAPINQMPSQQPGITPQPAFNASPTVEAFGNPPGLIQPSPASSMPPTNATGQNKTKLIIGVVVAIIILAVGAAFALSPKKSSTSQSGGDKPSPTNNTSKGNALTAEYLSEFSAVCSGSTISNAADYTGTAPHPIALFESGLIDANDYTSSSVYLSDQTWSATTENFAKTQLVGCFSKKSTNATGKKCELKDSSENTVSLEQYNVVYSLKIYEAKSGKKLGEKEISGPATTCPFFASYNKNDPKLYGDPDKGATTEAVKEFVTK